MVDQGKNNQVQGEAREPRTQTGRSWSRRKPAEPTRACGQAAPAAAAPAVDENLVEIKSPMVGTFYRSPSPGAKPYVEVGEMLQRGQVVCIIEAMKLDERDSRAKSPEEWSRCSWRMPSRSSTGSRSSWCPLLRRVIASVPQTAA